MDILIWAILVVVFVITELCTVQLVSIWLAAAALLTMICAFVFDGLPFLGQLGIFVISSAVFLVVSVPLIRKRTNKKHIATNSELDIGKSATVIEEIDPAKNSGRVTLNGVDWSAVPEKDEVISKDSVVTITDVKGSKLVVKLK